MPEMGPTEATGWAVKLAQAYPGRNIAEGTVRVWAEDLAGEERPVAIAALRIATDTYLHRPPSAGELREAIRAARGRHPDVRPALPEPEVDPEEAREAAKGFAIEVERLQARWAERDRSLAERADEAAGAALEALRASARAGTPGVCPAIGEPMVRRGRHLLCPRCETDLDPDCPPGPNRCLAASDRGETPPAPGASEP